MQNKKQEFIEGKTYFTSKGEEVRLVSKVLNGDYLVEPALHYDTYDYDYEESDSVDLYGSPYTVGRLFHKPPIKKVDDEVKELLAQKEELKTEIPKLVAKIAKIEKELRKTEEKRLAVHSKYDALENLNEFISGKVTHYAITDKWSRIRIVKREDYKNNEDDEGAGLLTLFGKNDTGELNWGLNKWYDGSGDYKNVTPCQSHEEALEVIQKHILSLTETVNYHSHEDVMEFANFHNLELPPNYASNWKQWKLEKYNENIAYNNKNLAEAIQERDDFTSKTKLNIKEN